MLSNGNGTYLSAQTKNFRMAPPLVKIDKRRIVMTYLPLPFREKETETECAYCKHTKIMPKTISFQKYMKLENYLDGFKKV